VRETAELVAVAKACSCSEELTLAVPALEWRQIDTKALQRQQIGSRARCLRIIPYLGVFRQGNKFLGVSGYKVKPTGLPIGLCLFDALAS